MLPFRSDKTYGEVLDRARHDVEAWRNAQGPGRKTAWAEWAGSESEVMMREREATLRCLDSQHTSTRLAAISLVAEYWPPNERFAPRVLQMAFEDQEETIRGAALAALWWLKTYIVDDTGFLGRLLSDLFPTSSDEILQDFWRRSVDRLARGRELWKKMWEDKTGGHAPEMLQSRAAAESFLNHVDPQVRCGALLALGHFWRPDAHFAQHCEKLLFDDPDCEVRELALSELVGCHFHTDDQRVGNLVARLVYDDSSLPGLRTAAYQSLFSLRATPIESFLKATANNCRFPEDVDWVFVNSFLRDT